MKVSEGKRRLRLVFSVVTLIVAVATFFSVGVSSERPVENAFTNLLYKEQPNKTHELDFELFLKRAGKMQEYRVTGSHDRGVFHLKLSSSLKRAGMLRKYEIIDFAFQQRVMVYEVDQPLSKKEAEVLLDESRSRLLSARAIASYKLIDEISRTPYLIAAKWLLLAIASILPSVAVFYLMTSIYWVLEGFRKA